MISLLTICKPIGFIIICMNITFPFMDKYWLDQRKLEKSLLLNNNKPTENKKENKKINHKFISR